MILLKDEAEGAVSRIGEYKVDAGEVIHGFTCFSNAEAKLTREWSNNPNSSTLIGDAASILG
jgi:hypothetical protein